MRSKRQYPLRRFAPAAVAPVNLVVGASSPSSAADSAARGKTGLTTITIARQAAAVFDGFTRARSPRCRGKASSPRPTTTY